MTKRITGIFIALALVFGAFAMITGSNSAKAADVDTAMPLDWAGSLLVRSRVAAVITSNKQSLTPALNTSVSDTVIPELDFSYFLTDNIAFEAICCVSWHTAKLTGGPDIGNAVIIPATITAQYHFQLGNGFKPYVGVGPHMTIVLSDKAKAPFTSFKLKNPRLGVAFQAGADWMLNDHWMLNVDVKKVFVSLKANVNNGGVVGKVKINPWIIGIGAGYKF